jgi:hypothetical protein
MAEAMLFYGCAGIFPHPHFLAARGKSPEEPEKSLAIEIDLY